MNISFAGFFTADQFEAIAAHFARRPEGNAPGYDTWRKAYQDMLSDVLAPALQSFFIARRDNVGLDPIRGSENRHIPFATAWNRIAAGENPTVYDWQDVTRTFTILAMQAIYRPEPYASFCRQITDGDIDWCLLNGDFTCRRTGERFRLSFDGWKGSLSTGDGAPVSQIGAAPAIIELPFEVVSGRMLAADWFRIEAFTKATQTHEIADIEFEDKRSQQTRDYLEKMGFISVSTGNACPDLLQFGDDVVCGDEPLEGPASGAEFLAHVSTRFWWVTVIEEEKLIALLAPAIGEEAAKAAIEELVEDDQARRFTMKPGSYTLSYPGDEARFEEAIVARQPALGKLDTIFFTLSPRS